MKSVNSEEKEKQKEKKAAEEAKPKRVRSAFAFFFSERFSTLQQQSSKVDDKMKALAELWKTLPDAEKQVRRAIFFS